MRYKNQIEKIYYFFHQLESWKLETLNQLNSE